MKKKIWTFVFSLLGAFIFIWLILPGLITNGSAGDATQLAKINELAQYLNDKYGYSLTVADCVDYVGEDYDHRGNFFGYGSSSDVPFVAAFIVDGQRILATDRKGFLSDDGQLDELNDLLCGYYTEITGLEGLEYVDIRRSSGSIHGDPTAGLVLMRHCNVLLNEENIGEYVDALFENEKYVQITFYFREKEDREAQLDEITQKLAQIDKPENMVILQFYTILGDEPLHVTEDRVDLDYVHAELKKNAYDFSYGAYYVTNPYEMYIESEDAFGYRGFYPMDRGYPVAGYGAYNEYKFDVNGWTMADLTQEVEGSDTTCGECSCEEGE